MQEGHGHRHLCHHKIPLGTLDIGPFVVSVAPSNLQRAHDLFHERVAYDQLLAV